MKVATLSDAVRDMENGTYNFTENGKCTGCGSCCSRMLPMTEKEIEVIRRYIKKHHINECKHFLPTAKPTFDMNCPFLNFNGGNHKCRIYPARPRVCKDFICDPAQRLLVDMEYKMKCRIVDVRSEFYS